MFLENEKVAFYLYNIKLNLQVVLEQYTFVVRKFICTNM